jgi:2-methylcitrate dehydratase PrpD
LPSPSLSRQLADRLAAVTFADLPADAIEEAERATLDWYGSTLAGSFEPPARMAREIAVRLGASVDATIFGGGKGSAAAAAFANGVACHILELDDVHKGSTLHAAAPVISAAYAVAEREHASGERFLLAVVAGYDAALRIGEAVNPGHYRFWHPTGTAATFGAAVAAGSLLGLTGQEMLDALGSAGTQAAGLWEFNADGTMSKHLHPGKAAMNGILAADLARAGFTGASRILEGERGFFRSMTGTHDASRITEALGTHWKVTENCYKLHACCGHTHSAIDLALSARQAAPPGAGVMAIEIDTYGPGYEIVKEQSPKTPYQARFSLAYCVAAALSDGAVGLAQFPADRFTETGVRDPVIGPLLNVTTIRVSEDLTRRYPAAWPARLRLQYADGTTWSGAADFPRGNPENPVGTSTLVEKFTALVAPRLGAPAAAKALGSVRTLRQAPDVSGWLTVTPTA